MWTQSDHQDSGAGVALSAAFVSAVYGVLTADWHKQAPEPGSGGPIFPHSQVVEGW